jgi:biotin-dependent carboxylase-like uncharacterized protein
MTGQIRILRASPQMTVQDDGRPALTAQGLATGGAADLIALAEAAALFGSAKILSAVEMAGMGGDLSVTSPTRIALTGAPMRTKIDGKEAGWNQTHLILPGQTLSIGGALSGLYGYLTVAGGIATDPVLGSRSTHLVGNIGKVLIAGDVLPIGDDPSPAAPPVRIAPEPRFTGGEVRIMPGPQTGLFADAELARFLSTGFVRGSASNRQGVRLENEGAPFQTGEAAGLASDFIAAGDVQMTGDGVPYVLLAECQTMGGYPRIGTVIGADLPRIAQLPLGGRVQFTLISVEEADRLYRTPAQMIAEAKTRVAPLVRNPHEISDLLGYQLIGGVVSGQDEEED